MRSRDLLRSATAMLLVGTTLASAGLSTGCTSVRTIAPATAGTPPSLARIKPGDEVTVLTRDGTSASFRVMAVRDETVVADDRTRYERRDIVRLERRELSGVKTAFLIGGIAVAAFGVGLLFAFASLVGGMT